MNTMTHPAMQAMRKASQAPTRPNHDYSTTIGEGSGIVHCQFNVSDDGDIEDLIVESDEGQNILKYLTEDQVSDLEYGCYQNYLKECEESRWDTRIAAWEDRRAA